jgi:C_GCAxxG_C_C family probable redox protein
MNKSDQAAEYFRSGFNCAQSVFTPFGREFGLSEEQCLKVSCAFGAGMGRMQHTCGAVTGALMALGLQFGKGMGDDNVKKLQTYEKSSFLIREFAERHGSAECLELLDGLRMSDPEDMKKIEALGLHNTRCTKYVRDAAEITEKLLGTKLQQE